MKFRVKGKTDGGKKKTVEVEAGSNGEAFARAEEKCPGFQSEEIASSWCSFRPWGRRARKRPADDGI